MRRVDAGEFDGGDKFHRFVTREIYPLLVAGTLKADDLKALSLHFARHAGVDAPGVAAPQDGRTPARGRW
jgi:hypothetical protein